MRQLMGDFERLCAKAPRLRLKGIHASGIETQTRSASLAGQRWKDDVILHNSVISGQCLGDNERLCAMEPNLWLERVLS